MQTTKNPLIAQNSDAQFRKPVLFEVTSAEKSVPLGTNTESCSKLDSKGFQESTSLKKRQSYRSFTIALKERAGEILYDPKKPINKQNRVCACGKVRRHKEESVSVSINQTTGDAKFGNLVHCGSVWLCPDCSYKISQERKKELAEAMKACRDKGLHVAMLTPDCPALPGR